MKYVESDGMSNSDVSNYPPAPPPPFVGYPMEVMVPMPAVGPTPAMDPPPPNVYVNGNANAVNVQCYPIPPTNVPERRDELPCGGLGLGWLLFIIGFFLGIPWYAGFFLLLCNKDPREKSGFIACTIAATFLTIIVSTTTTTT